GNRYCTGVKYLRPNLALVSADSGIVLRSTDGGISWMNIQTSTQESFTDIMAVDTNCAYVCGSNGAVFKTLNGGLTWTNVSINTTTWLQGVYFTTRNIGLAVGGNQIYKTSNGGLSWALKNTGVDINTSFNDVWMIDADIAFAGGTFGKLYKTFDGANFWNPIYPASSTNAGIEEMDWQTDSIGYFATNSSQSITLNGGSVLGTLSTACLANNGGMDAICIPQDGYGYSTGGLSRVLHTVKPQGIISAYLQDSAFCSGSRIFVGYGAEGLLISTHVMSVQLSDASGNFSSPTTIGTYTLGLPSTNPSGIITCTLPSGINGQGYRVRVVCDTPALVGPDNGFDIRIGTTLTPSVQILTDANPICAGQSVTLTAAGSALGLSPAFTWLVGGNAIAHTS
ncbi:MAG: WD40/YVTN/BNR-like repeat-containing protein, partial [Bacteroidia bacterium]